MDSTYDSKSYDPGSNPGGTFCPTVRSSTYGLVGDDVRLTRGRAPVRSWVGVLYGSLAQMVEHWSNKPRVMGSIPIGTILLHF